MWHLPIQPVTSLTGFPYLTSYLFSKINADSSAKRLCYTTLFRSCNCDGHAKRIFLKKYFQHANDWNKLAYKTSSGQKNAKCHAQAMQAFRMGEKWDGK